MPDWFGGWRENIKTHIHRNTCTQPPFRGGMKNLLAGLYVNDVKLLLSNSTNKWQKVTPF